MRSQGELNEVQSLVAQGQSDAAIARATGIPRRTISDWRRGCNLIWTRSREDYSCTELHDFSSLPPHEYAYLLGLYLGDGCISQAKRGVYCLRISLDARYPGIIAECQRALDSILPKKTSRAGLRPGSKCVDVSMWSKHWPCLIPQHGPGPKHLRLIQLEDWQVQIVADQRRAFLRGLIHSDGTRFIATEKRGSYTRRAARYAFSNRSDDIKGLFCESCDALGVKWTRPNSMQIAIYRKDSVAILDEFVGPKS